MTLSVNRLCQSNLFFSKRLASVKTQKEFLKRFDFLWKCTHTQNERGNGPSFVNLSRKFALDQPEKENLVAFCKLGGGIEEKATHSFNTILLFCAKNYD